MREDQVDESCGRLLNDPLNDDTMATVARMMRRRTLRLMVWWRSVIPFHKGWSPTASHRTPLSYVVVI
jgi:hypothetical protein